MSVNQIRYSESTTLYVMIEVEKIKEIEFLYKWYSQSAPEFVCVCLKVHPAVLVQHMHMLYVIMTLHSAIMALTLPQDIIYD